MLKEHEHAPPEAFCAPGGVLRASCSTLWEGGAL